MLNGDFFFPSMGGFQLVMYPKMDYQGDMGVSKNGGTPIAGELIREHPIKNIQMDDDWGYPVMT